jgi:hypothetical protein
MFYLREYTCKQMSYQVFTLMYICIYFRYVLWQRAFSAWREFVEIQKVKSAKLILAERHGKSTRIFLFSNIYILLCYLIEVIEKYQLLTSYKLCIKLFHWSIFLYLP